MRARYWAIMGVCCSEGVGMAGMGGKPAKAQTVTVAQSGMSQGVICNKCFKRGSGFAILRRWCFVLFSLAD